MRKRVRSYINWIDHRTGLETAVRNFLLEDIPASAGWAQVFGSIALFLFLVQAFTGILLSFNFAATAGDSYNSLVYIVREVPLGRVIRNLHHWGASAMLVVIVAHMIQVFVYGAYKKPREATWLVGVVLLLLTLTFALTGYLLPWDNRAYWGTVVTTQIMGLAPVLGPYLQNLVGAQNGIGVVTFSRFYSLHTLILPVTMIFLVGMHIILVRRHGVTPAPFDTRPTRKFYPEQVFRDAISMFVIFVILFTAALLFDPPLERLADPTDASYVPRPEWYFLFLFQTLKLFQGSLEPIGAVVLPTLAILVLFCTPFIDRSRLKKAQQRTAAIAIVVLALAGWSALTAAAVRGTPKKSEARESAATQLRTPMQFSAEETAGIGYFRQEHCESCHNLIGGQPKIGPNLVGEGKRRSADWIIEHFKNPGQMVPGSNMPPIQLNPAELNALSAFLLTVTPENARDLEQVPPELITGAQVYISNLCESCHKVNGVGGEIGPSLNGLADRRQEQWVRRHFVDPKKLSPGTIMPPYHFSEAQEDALLSYLYALP
jgi:ubiquinol-cytochrome c reductase cytochrome b subunit